MQSLITLLVLLMQSQGQPQRMGDGLEKLSLSSSCRITLSMCFLPVAQEILLALKPFLLVAVGFAGEQYLLTQKKSSAGLPPPDPTD